MATCNDISKFIIQLQFFNLLEIGQLELNIYCGLQNSKYARGMSLILKNFVNVLI